MNNKKWTLGCLLLVFIILVSIALLTVILDPYFHYHKPLPGVSYKLDNQRYQNAGILKHFPYDMIITGTSMTENFKASEADVLFGATSVKVPFSGGSYKEIGDNLTYAFACNSGIRYVVRGIDCNRIADHKDAMTYEMSMYPWYLYDDSPFNDVTYVLNKSILFEDTLLTIGRTILGFPGTTFDEYSNWAKSYSFGKEALLKTYIRPELSNQIWQVEQMDYIQLQESVQQNFLSHVQAHPETEFFYFFTPYSIVWWDSINRAGKLEGYVALMEELSRILIEYDNVHLFSFFENTDLICNLDKYKDSLHYSEDINSQILQWMYHDTYRLTEENYIEHWNSVLTFYNSYDYEALFE